MSRVNDNFYKGVQMVMGGVMQVASNLPGGMQYDFRNLEKIPTDVPCVFVVNHSNSHDYPSLMRVLSELSCVRERRLVNTLVASDSLNLTNELAFRVSGAELINRFDKESSRVGANNLSSALSKGNDVLFFAEGTWNLHPYEPMQVLKKGFVNVAQSADCAVVPIVFEYVENKDICQKESEIYKKLIVSVCEPIRLDDNAKALEVAMEVRKIMINSRLDLWKETKTHAATLSGRKFNMREEDVYLNHTHLKKNGDGFSFQSVYELDVLLPLENGMIENEYVRDENGLFVPLTKNNGHLLTLKK